MKIRRSKGPIGIDDYRTREERNERQAALKKIMDRCDEREFMTFVRKCGVKDGTPHFSEMVSRFRAHCRGKRRTV